MKFKPGICVYCGNHGSLTPDHVFARGFFPEDRPRPSNPVIVPSCKPCNDRKGGDDSYVRDYFNSDHMCTGNPIVRQNLDGPIARSIRKGHSQFMKTAFHRARLAPSYSEGGIYLTDLVAIPVLGKRVQRWGRLVCRGLYFAHMRTRIPDEYDFDTHRVIDSKRAWAYDHMMAHGALGPFLMGAPDEETDQVVTWTYLVDKENHFRSVWLLWFYQSIYIKLFSLAPGDRQQIENGGAIQNAPKR